MGKEKAIISTNAKQFGTGILEEFSEQFGSISWQESPGAQGHVFSGGPHFCFRPSFLLQTRWLNWLPR
jgi:hypothetical protein